MNKNTAWKQYNNSNEERKCKFFSFCEITFTLFCSLLYLTLFQQNFFELLFGNKKTTEQLKVIQNQLEKNKTIFVNLINNTNITNNSTSICEWSQWSECDSFCGFGQKTREINTPPCNFIVEKENCYSECEPCPLSNWTEWSECSTTLSCIPGTQTRTRSILSNIFCNDTILSPLQEENICYFNCSEAEIRNLNYSFSLTQNFLYTQKTPEKIPENNSSEETSGTLLLPFLVGVAGFFTLLFFSYQKYHSKTENNLSIKPPGVVTNKSLDSPCERGQLMTLNPLMDFESLKNELTKATQLDKQKKYADAYLIYIQGSSILLSMRDKEKKIKQRRIYTDYAKTYIKRAEDIAIRYPSKIKNVKNSMNRFPLRTPTSASLSGRNLAANTRVPPSNNLRRNTSMVVGSHKFSPRKSTKLKPPPLLSKTCESESENESKKPTIKAESVQLQHHNEESSASSSDGDGDCDTDSSEDNKEGVGEGIYKGNYMIPKMREDPAKPTREKIKKEFKCGQI